MPDTFVGEPEGDLPPRIAPSTIRYVKLGPAGTWVQACLEEGRLYFGTEHDPHRQAAEGDWPAVREASLALGMTPGAATANTTEMQAFYSLGVDCLWISFARGHLWWGFADKTVHALPARMPDGRRHYRKMIDGWHCTDLVGAALRIDQLSSNLTQLAGYRRTICRVRPETYLLRIINVDPDSIAAEIRQRQAALASAVKPLIEDLHWQDLELFVELLLTRMGWRRVSAIGGRQADVDMIAELPATGERIAVQVKSRLDATQARQMLHSLSDAKIAERTLLAVATLDGALGDQVEPGIWWGAKLASDAIEHGLTDWLLDHRR